MEEIRITLTMMVNINGDGTDELYLRVAADKAKEMIDLVGRGKFIVERKFEIVKSKKKRKK